MEVVIVKKRNRNLKSADFTRIIQKRNSVVNKTFILNSEKNTDNVVKFGICFVKNIGNAVTRNKLKRRTKEIIDHNKNIYQNNRNYIIIIKKAALEKTYQELEKDLIALFNKEKETKNEK